MPIDSGYGKTTSIVCKISLGLKISVFVEEKNGVFTSCDSFCGYYTGQWIFRSKYKIISQQLPCLTQFIAQKTGIMVTKSKCVVAPRNYILFKKVYEWKKNSK